MKITKNIFLLVLMVAFSANTMGQQKDYYLKKGFVLEGYDVTSYFEGTPLKGNTKITTTYDGVKYAFAKEENKKKFIASPEKFTPQYGGYCAYAIAMKGEKYKVNPETFEIRDGKLYLFYNAWGNNTLKNWQKEDPQALQAKADNIWPSLQYRN